MYTELYSTNFGVVVVVSRTLLITLMVDEVL